MKRFLIIPIAMILLISFACSTDNNRNETGQSAIKTEDKVAEYEPFTLSSDLSGLTENQRKMIPILIEVAQIMDDLFWREAYGNRAELMKILESDAERRFAEINYGPWDRLRENEPFIQGVNPKAPGAQFYPEDMTTEEFKNWDSQQKKDAYTFVRRNDEGELFLVPYHEAFSKEVKEAANLLLQAAELAEDEAFKNYLTLRAEALVTDQYQAK
jgi:hypothetical protein